jgi:hypothetical protein
MPTRKKAAGRRQRTTQRPSTASNLAELIQVQQQFVGRVADFWSKAASRLAEGNFDLTAWLTDYSDIWKGMVDDFAVVLKTTLPKKR